MSLTIELDKEVDADVRFSERAQLSTTSKISKEGVLKDVHLIGLIGKANRAKGSKKPYTYKESAIKEAADGKLYDGVPIYLGHAKEDASGNEIPRDPQDKIGILIAGKYKEGVGAVGDIQFNTGHPYYEATRFWVDKDPSAIMMSHVAELRYEAATNQISKITKVHSVDIVVNGNTTEAMFKEGVLADSIKVEDEQRKLQRLIDTAQSMMWRVLYPSYSETQKKVLTDAEKAVSCATIAKDLVKELNALSSTKKEAVMEYKDITLEDLKKNRPELIQAVESAAISAENQINEKVTEAVKDIPADKRSTVFLKSVREAVVANKTDEVKALVADRKGLLTVETTESTVLNEGVNKPNKAPAKKPDEKVIKEEVAALFAD